MTIYLKESIEWKIGRRACEVKWSCKVIFFKNIKAHKVTEEKSIDREGQTAVRKKNSLWESSESWVCVCDEEVKNYRCYAAFGYSQK